MAPSVDAASDIVVDGPYRAPPQMQQGAPECAAYAACPSAGPAEPAECAACPPGAYCFQPYPASPPLPSYADPAPPGAAAAQRPPAQPLQPVGGAVPAVSVAHAPAAAPPLRYFAAGAEDPESPAAPLGGPCPGARWVDRGSALPLGARATCGWCHGMTWNRGCSACGLNFHRSCYRAHLRQGPHNSAAGYSTPAGPSAVPAVLRQVGMAESAAALVAAGIDDLALITEDALKRAGVTKVVHRRKLLRYVAKRLYARAGDDDDETGGELSCELRVARAPGARLGLTLSEEAVGGGGVLVRDVAAASPAAAAGFEAGMIVGRIDGAAVRCQRSFMHAVQGKAAFSATVRFRASLADALCAPPCGAAGPGGGAAAARATAGDFVAVRRLGGGGAGVEVHLVCGRRDGRLYALKSVAKGAIARAPRDGAAALRRDLLRERDMMRRASTCAAGGARLVRLHHTFQTPTRLCFLVDYCAGGDLRSLLSRHRSGLAEEQARHYAAQIFLALRALHTHGVLYRALRTPNVLLDARGHARLADFAASRALAWSDRATSVVGEPGWMAPEMLRGEPYSFAVDWWAYGAVVFAALSGAPPFPAAAACVLRDEPRWDGADGAGAVPGAARGLLQGLLEKDPACRLEGAVVARQPWLAAADWVRAGAAEGDAPLWSPPEGIDDDVAAAAAALPPGLRLTRDGEELPGPGLSSDDQALFRGFSLTADGLE